MILKWLTLVILEGPTPVTEGLRRLETILEQYRGDRSVEINVTRVRAQLEAMRGRFDEARQTIGRAKALSRELGDQVTLSALLGAAGSVEMLAGDLAAAEEELRAGHGILERIGDVGHLASSAPNLGDAVYEQGRHDEALRLAEAAERITVAGDLDAGVRWRQLRAKALARLGRQGEAEAVAMEAVRLAAPTQNLDLHAHALLALAEVLRLASRRLDAASAVREALDLYRRKGNIVAEARAVSLLEELSG